MQLYEQQFSNFESKKRLMFRELVRKSSRQRRIRFATSASTASRLVPSRLRRYRKMLALKTSSGGHEGISPPADYPVALGCETSRRFESFGGREIEVVSLQVMGLESGTNIVAPGEAVMFRIAISAHVSVPDLTVGIELSDGFGEVVFGTNTFMRGASRSVLAGRDYDVVFGFPANLNRGRYTIGVALHTGSDHTDRCFDWRDNIAELEVAQLGEPDFIGYCRLEPEIEWFESMHSPFFSEPAVRNAEKVATG
jgi:hypothetical protein